MNQYSLRIIGGGLIFLSFLWVAAGAAYWLRMPRIFQATVRFTMPEKHDPDDPHFVQKELEKVQSKMVLNQVITNLNLKKKWAARYGKEKELTDVSIYHMLEQRLHLSVGRGTDLLEVRVRSEDPLEASQIANEIAQVYRDVSLTETRKQRLAAGTALTPTEHERSTVEIVDQAEPPLRPISPNLLAGFLNLVPGFFLGIGGLVMLSKSRKASQ